MPNRILKKSFLKKLNSQNNNKKETKFLYFPNLNKIKVVFRVWAWMKWEVVWGQFQSQTQLHLVRYTDYFQTQEYLCDFQRHILLQPQPQLGAPGDPVFPSITVRLPSQLELTH